MLLRTQSCRLVFVDVVAVAVVVVVVVAVVAVVVVVIVLCEYSLIECRM